MPKKQKELIVLSLGGSIVVPDEIDIKFLKKFKNLIIEKIRKDKRFIIVVGGGKICRRYQSAASKVSELQNKELDWLGIQATKLNAHLLKAVFTNYANPEINSNPTKFEKFREDILIASGWKPGASTDLDAVLLAKTYNAKKIINMTNIDYVYDVDPRKSSSAKPLPKLNWREYRKVVGNKWGPGANAPFDPIASRKAENFNMTVTILKGIDLNNFNNCLNNKRFKGTVISN